MPSPTSIHPFQQDLQDLSWKWDKVVVCKAFADSFCGGCSIVTGTSAILKVPNLISRSSERLRD